jgi:hypothetical protein
MHPRAGAKRPSAIGAARATAPILHPGVFVTLGIRAHRGVETDDGRRRAGIEWNHVRQRQ